MEAGYFCNSLWLLCSSVPHIMFPADTICHYTVCLFQSVAVVWHPLLNRTCVTFGPFIVWVGCFIALQRFLISGLTTLHKFLSVSLGSKRCHFLFLQSQLKDCKKNAFDTQKLTRLNFARPLNSVNLQLQSQML